MGRVSFAFVAGLGFDLLVGGEGAASLGGLGFPAASSSVLPLDRSIFGLSLKVEWGLGGAAAGMWHVPSLSLEGGAVSRMCRGLAFSTGGAGAGGGGGTPARLGRLVEMTWIGVCASTSSASSGFASTKGNVQGGHVCN